MEAPTCNADLPVRLTEKGSPMGVLIRCHRKFGHFRRHSSVYQRVSVLASTKITIKWSTKENR